MLPIPTTRLILIPVLFNPLRPTILALSYAPAPSFVYVNQSDQFLVFNVSLKKYTFKPTLKFEIEDNQRIPITQELLENKELTTIQLAELDPVVLKTYKEAVIYLYSKHWIEAIEEEYKSL